MTDNDDLEQRLPRHLKGRAPTAPAGLLDNLLRQTADLPQRRGILPFASSAWWAVGAAVALLVAALALRSALPGPSVPPGGQVSPSPSSEPSMTTITVTSPVHDKAIILQATDVMSARLRALGIGNFTASGSGDDTTFSFVLPASVDLADVQAVLNTPGDIEWLAWSAEPWPVEGDPVRPDVPRLFDASAQVLSATVRPASSGSPEGVVVSLGPLAADAVAAYTAAHIGEPAMPLAMDGIVLISPTIQGVISSGGNLVITFGIDSPISAQALAAIMASGPLPAPWSSSPAGSPSPPPTPEPSPSPPPGYVAVDGLPITVLASDAADVLFSEVQTCVSDAGYTVEFPASWYTNAAMPGAPACTWFAPRPLDTPGGSPSASQPPPDGVWITMQVFDGAAGYTSLTPIYLSEVVTITGHDGQRAEFGHSTLDEIQSDPGYRAYWYLIPLGDISPTLMAETSNAVVDDYPLAKAVLDRMMASITFQPR